MAGLTISDCGVADGILKPARSSQLRHEWRKLICPIRDCMHAQSTLSGAYPLQMCHACLSSRSHSHGGEYCKRRSPTASMARFRAASVLRSAAKPKDRI